VGGGESIDLWVLAFEEGLDFLFGLICTHLHGSGQFRDIVHEFLVLLSRAIFDIVDSKIDCLQFLVMLAIQLGKHLL